METPNSNNKDKIRFLILLIILTVFSGNVNSNTINISVGDFSFTPSEITAKVGDKIKWTWTGSYENSIICDGIFPGTSLPNGAISWNVLMSNSNPVFEYIITIAGTYNYTSKSHKTQDIIARIIAESSLPVELTDFVATTIKNEVILDWSTGSEMNNDRFEIQRVEVVNSTDNNPAKLDFVTIGVLTGNGTINHIRTYKYRDRNLKSGIYMYRLRQVDYNSNYIYHLLNDEIVIGVPSKFYISQNFPNPFNPVTKISYELPYDGFVNLSLIDVSGRLISTLVNDNVSAGYQTVEVNGTGLSSGIYFYRIEYKNQNDYNSVTKKMLLVK